jgi:WhiB family redox-sensing transcriptional regulator
MATDTAEIDLVGVGVDERPWAALASCRRYDPDIFFPGSEESSAAALRVCRACPVMDDCREWALDARVRYGVWGGLTERERRRMLRRSA